MNLFFYLIIFLFGLNVGSFLNCIIHRLQTGESFLFTRSYCPSCKHQLNWPDLIPILSLIILRGRCRYCHKLISLQYPLVELATGILFVLTFHHSIYELRIANCELRILWNLSYQLFIVSCLLVIFVYDLKHYIIPDKIIYPAIAIAFFYQLFRILDFEFVSNFEFRISSFQPLMYPFLSAILASGFFLSIILISRGRWMGLGDFKLAILMGLFLGWPNILVALFLAFFLGAIIGIGLILSGKKTLKSEIPFGPFLVTGTFIAMFWGRNLINWYLNLLAI